VRCDNHLGLQRIQVPSGPADVFGTALISLLTLTCAAIALEKNFSTSRILAFADGFRDNVLSRVLTDSAVRFKLLLITLFSLASS